MLRIIFGIIFMVGAFVVLFMFIQGPEDNALVGQVMTSLHCREGEHFVQEVGAYVDNFGTSADGRTVNFYCEDERERQREVTGEAVLTLIAGFAVPFILGLLIMLWGIFALAWKAMRGVTNAAMNGFGGSVVQTGQPSMFGQPVTTSTTYMTVDGKQVDPSQVPPEKMQQIQDVFKALGMNAPQMGSNMVSSSTPMTGADFVAQLKQLEDARNQNLITQDEYDRMRKEILDKMA
jgi:hypothetical protein